MRRGPHPPLTSHVQGDDATPGADGPGYHGVGRSTMGRAVWSSLPLHSISSVHFRFALILVLYVPKPRPLHQACGLPQQPGLHPRLLLPKVQVGPCLLQAVHGGKLLPEKGVVGGAGRVEGLVLQVALQRRQVLDKLCCDGRGIEVGIGEPGPDEVNGDWRGMEHVRGVETVVAQVVHHDLKGREVGKKVVFSLCFAGCVVEDVVDGREQVRLAAGALHCRCSTRVGR